MSAVCAAALLGGLVDLDVLDNQVAGVETLGIGVGLGVLEQTEEELGGLLGPAGAGDTKLLAYFPPQSALLLMTMTVPSVGPGQSWVGHSVTSSCPNSHIPNPGRRTGARLLDSYLGRSGQ